MSTGRRIATAQAVAAFRAAEHLRPADERIFDDPFAELFVTNRWLLRMLARPRLTRAVVRWRDLFASPGIINGAMLRYRYADDALRDAAESGIRQLVLIGAGFDSTGLRRPAGDGVSIFELDLPHVLETKRELLAERDAYGATRVPCDLANETISDALSRTGFARDEPALFNWLGVTMFLEQGAVEATVRDLASLAAPRSRLLFDYVDRSVVDGTTGDRDARRTARVVRRRGEPFRFGLTRDEAVPWVEGLGFQVLRHEQPDTVIRRYFPDRPSLPAPAYFALVLAERG
ncbi:MAG: class I SAM-dependent methyltransferase [Gaiellaceae bacterium]